MGTRALPVVIQMEESRAFRSLEDDIKYDGLIPILRKCSDTKVSDKEFQSLRFSPLSQLCRENLPQNLLLGGTVIQFKNTAEDLVFTVPSKILQTDKNGACFYSTVSYALTGSSEAAICIRKFVCKSIIPSFYTKLTGGSYNQMIEYLEKEEKPSTYADVVSITATAIAFDVTLVIYNVEEDIWDFIAPEHGLGRRGQICLRYIENHYQLVLDVATPETLSTNCGDTSDQAKTTMETETTETSTPNNGVQETNPEKIAEDRIPDEFPEDTCDQAKTTTMETETGKTSTSNNGGTPSTADSNVYAQIPANEETSSNLLPKTGEKIDVLIDFESASSQSDRLELTALLDGLINDPTDLCVNEAAGTVKDATGIVFDAEHEQLMPGATAKRKKKKSLKGIEMYLTASAVAKKTPGENFRALLSVSTGKILLLPMTLL